MFNSPCEANVAEYTIPELPPGYSLTSKDCGFPFGIEWDCDASRLVALVDSNVWAMMAPNGGATWTWHQKFDSVQDAINVVVTRLWLGMRDE
jgi:hypothetical protein